MRNYDVEYVMYTPEFGSEVVKASSEKDAEELVIERLKEEFPEASDVEIVIVKEV